MRSKSVWSPSHRSEETPKYFDNRSAVSAVMARFPLTIALMRPGGTAISRSEPVDADPQRFHEFLQENLTGMNRIEQFLRAIVTPQW
jgi:hypothetical protein